MPGPIDDWFPWYWKRFEADTHKTGWTHALRGTYRWLIDQIMASGGRFGENDLKAAARYEELDIRTARRRVHKLIEFGKLSLDASGRYHTKRTDQLLRNRRTPEPSPCHPRATHEPSTSHNPTFFHKNDEQNQGAEGPLIGEDREERILDGAQARRPGNGSAEIHDPEEVIVPNSEEHKKLVYRVARRLGRPSAPTEMAKHGLTLSKIEAELRMAESADDPRSYLGKVIQNMRRPPPPDPRDTYEELFK